MQHAALLGAYDADPFAVDIGELLLVVDALVEIGERFLLVSAAFGGLYHGRGFFAGAAGAFALTGAVGEDRCVAAALTCVSNAACFAESAAAEFSASCLARHNCSCFWRSTDHC